MTCTPEQAVDEMFTLVKDAWDTNIEEYVMLWPDVAGEIPQDGSAPWARTSIDHNIGNQASLANHEGKRRWRKRGFLTVQIFTPMGFGTQKKYALAKVVSDALEGVATPSSVWLKNVTINEIGPSGAYIQTNVLAQFEYDEVR